MLHSHIAICLLAFLTAVSSVTQSHGLSNAQRLARGLRLNKPKRLYDASRIHAPHARRSATPDVQGDTIAIGSPSTTRKRDIGLRFLTVLDSGALSSTTDQTAADVFIPPGPGGGTLKWLPRKDKQGFSYGYPYPMYARTTSGLSTLAFSPTLPDGAITNLFSASPFDGGFSPNIGGNSVQWIMSSDGGMYMAPSLATALNSLPGASTVLAQAVKAGTTPSIDKAKAVAANHLKNPATIYATTSAGDVQGYLVCADDTCSQLTIDSTNPGDTFYLPNLGSLSQQQQIQTLVSGKVNTLRTTPTAPKLYSISARLGTTNTAVFPMAGFTIASTGQGVFTPFIQPRLDAPPQEQIGVSSFMLTPGSRSPSICAASQCAALATGTLLCMELVPPGGTPGACQTYLHPPQPVDVQKHPVQLYLTRLTSDGSSVTSTGWATATVPGIQFSTSQSSASIFYLPNADQGGLQTMYTQIGGRVSVAQATFIDASGGLGIQPSFNIGTTGRAGYLTNFILVGLLYGGIVNPLPTDLQATGYQGTWTWYYSQQKKVLSAFTSLQAAQTNDPTVTIVCIETVAINSQPKGLCKPKTLPVYPKCSNQLYANLQGPYARLSLGDLPDYTGLQSVNGITTENDCLLQCVAKSCRGIIWLQTQLNCMSIVDTQYSYAALAPGNGSGDELVLPGTCGILRSKATLPTNVLATCCDNP